MKNFGLARLSDFLGDRVIYRNLVPYDAGLPGLEALRAEVGLPERGTPRKNEPDYARVVARILAAAQRQDAAHGPIERLFFVGDTRLLDAAAFTNLCAAGDWPGAAFIGSENSAPANVTLEQTENGRCLYLSNRWAALADFDRYCQAQDLPISAGAAVVIDLDKTALGARGRNAGVIDGARVQAVQETLAGLLGQTFDMAGFRAAYDPLNQPEFHHFTADNQDYLAYICLILGSGLVSLEMLIEQVRRGQLVSFEQFIRQVEGRKDELTPELRSIHNEIYANVRSGDPTPFKAFRRTEYRATLARFGRLAPDAPVEQLLHDEIVITQEVRALALEWRARGALLFGLSDKPDEAAIPGETLAAQGFAPLHRAQTHAVGESLD